MIWDTIDQTNWAKTAPYVDTLLIPVMAFNFADKGTFCAQDRDSFRAAAAIEQRLKGRLVLMPPISYIFDQGSLQSTVTHIRERARSGGFQHVFFLLDSALLQQTKTIDWGDHLEVAALPAQSTANSAKIGRLCDQLLRKWQE